MLWGVITLTEGDQWTNILSIFSLKGNIKASSLSRINIDSFISFHLFPRLQIVDRKAAVWTWSIKSQVDKLYIEVL